VILRAAVLWLCACLLAACAAFYSPSASMSIDKGDPVICAVQHERWCIARLWLYIKTRF
jgi:hypothetical protein